MPLPLQVILDTAPTVYAYPPLVDTFNNVTGVTAKVQTPASALPSSYSAASSESTASTTSAAASKGDTSLTLVDASSFSVGHRYGVGASSTSGALVLGVEVVEVDGNTIRLAEPLTRDVASGESVAGWRVEVSLTSTQTAERGRGLVLWRVETTNPTPSTYTDAARHYLEFQSEFWIVRQRVYPTLTASKLTALYPSVHRHRPPTDAYLNEVIGAAWEHRLIADLAAKGLDPWKVKSVDMLEGAHAAACVWHLVSDDDAAPPERIDRAYRDYADRLDRALESRRFWYDEADTLDPLDGVNDGAPSWTFTEYTR